MVKKAKRSAEKVELIKVSAARLEEFLEGRVIFNKSIDSNGVTVFRGILGGYKGQYDNFRFKILVSSWCVVSYAYLPFMVKQDKPAVSLRKISYPYIYATYSLMVFIVGISTDAILYLTVTCYKLLLAGFLKSPIFHNLL